MWSAFQVHGTSLNFEKLDFCDFVKVYQKVWTIFVCNVFARWNDSASSLMQFGESISTTDHFDREYVAL